MRSISLLRGGPSRRRLCLFALLALLPAAADAAGRAASASAATGALKKMSLEELMEIEVITVSRRPEKLREAAAAIRVITQEDIRRSGAASIPQALRLASSLQTGQVGSSYWTIAARGFNSTATTSNKLLVMIDGRSIYSPLFSGVFWDSQDIFLPDVDRIEVISGPGGAAWGANAVNGVVNILTRTARETQGTLLYGGAGTEERRFGGLRHGGRFGETGYYRVYAKHFDINGSARPNGTNARDRWDLSQTGFRTDWGMSGQNHFTFQGDIYTGWIAQPTAARGQLNGANALGRWTHTLPAGGEFQVQGYFDTTRRDAPNTFGDRLDTFDLSAQHRFLVGQRQTIVWGFDGRISNDHVRNLPQQGFRPADFTTRLTGIFAQDEVVLMSDRLRLTIGAKFEDNNYSGSDFQPSARLAWLATPEHTLWTAVSRAVRTPSRVDRDLFIPPSPPFLVGGGPNFDSETVIAYEAGWRGRIASGVTGSATAFLHDYDDLRTLEPTTPITFGNGLAGKTYGLEVSLEQTLTERWRWQAGYALLRKDTHLKPGSRDLNQGQTEVSDPRHKVQVQTSFALRSDLEVDLTWRHIAAVPTFASSIRGAVPAYAELDARMAWTSRPGLEFAVVGRNLLDRQHPEVGAAATRREIQRSISGSITWRF